MTPVREVHVADGFTWACYAETGGKCFAPLGALCPCTPGYHETRALRRAAAIAPHADVGRAPVYTPEMLLLSAAIVRTEREIAKRYPFDRNTDACCPGCKYGNNDGYAAWSAKLERQEAWLRVLHAKAIGGADAQRRASDRYGTLTADRRRL